MRLIELNNISESILLAREFITYYREQFKKYNSFVESTNFQSEPTVSDKDLEILYSCWRDEEKDKEFKHKMYQFRVKIQAKKDILDRIEYVIYRLSTAYKNNLRKTNDRANNFMLKEFAWGVSDIQVEIKIYNQTEIINLTQRVYLTETGPRYD